VGGFLFHVANTIGLFLGCVLEPEKPLHGDHTAGGGSNTAWGPGFEHHTAGGGSGSNAWGGSNTAGDNVAWSGHTAVGNTAWGGRSNATGGNAAWGGSNTAGGQSRDPYAQCESLSLASWRRTRLTIRGLILLCHLLFGYAQFSGFGQTDEKEDLKGGGLFSVNLDARVEVRLCLDIRTSAHSQTRPRPSLSCLPFKHTYTKGEDQGGRTLQREFGRQGRSEVILGLTRTSAHSQTRPCPSFSSPPFKHTHTRVNPAILKYMSYTPVVGEGFVVRVALSAPAVSIYISV